MPGESTDRAVTKPPLLQMRGIAKAFPGVQALDDVSFELARGEIHALVGENGAGKSTLIKVLNGVFPADAGEIRLDDQLVALGSPIEARRQGIATIYQEFMLVPALSVAANLFLGRECARRGLIDSRSEDAHALQLLSRLGVDIDPHTYVRELGVARQQMVEIGRALSARARILVMDEPTAALSPPEVERLFAILRELCAAGLGIMFISHRLEEVFAIADRITVMRDGRVVARAPASAMTRPDLIRHMVGRPLEQEFPRIAHTIGDVRLDVKGLTGGRVRDVSFAARRGEILGVTGLVGAGRTELARLLCGVDPRERGDVILDGIPCALRSPREAIRRGICLLTEDRKAQGLVLLASAKDNFALPNLGRWSRFGVINGRRELGRFRGHVQRLNIRLAGPDQRVQDLSGGNQQKLLVARWLESDSQVIVFDEPTRGIDVGAKYEMYLLLDDLAGRGRVVILISSELPEILGMCDRVLVMRNGEIAGEIDDPAHATQEAIMALAA